MTGNLYIKILYEANYFVNFAFKFFSLSSSILSSCRSLVFRDASVINDTFQILHRLHQTASKGTVYDMDVDHKMEIAVTVGQVII